MLLWKHIQRSHLRLFPSYHSFTSYISLSHRLQDHQYNPVSDCPFPYSSPPPFRLLADTFELLGEMNGINSKEAQKTIIANLFRTIIVLKPDHLVKTFFLCVGRLEEEYKGVEMRVGKGLLTKAIGKTLGIGEDEVKKLERDSGDLGDVYYAYRKDDTNSSVSVSEVYDELLSLAQLKGSDSVSQREAQLCNLLSRCSRLEGKYLIRFCQKSLKVGTSELTMQSALARAVALTPPQQGEFPPLIIRAETFEQDAEVMERIVKRAANESQDVQRLVNMLLMYGPKGYHISALSDLCRATPGIPVKPMTAQPCKSLTEVLKRLPGEFTCEFKYDGIRAQIHRCASGSIHIFSRNSEDITGMFPDVVDTIQRDTRGNDWIADCEIVAFDRVTGRIRPFQAIQTRKRGDVHTSDVTVNVCAFLFDLLYLNGHSIMSYPFLERRSLLSTHFPEVRGKLHLVTSRLVHSAEEVQQFLDEAISIGCEGLMAKSIQIGQSEYHPAKRSFVWLKIKKDYMEGCVSDSFDLVPIGASYGSGKRKGVFGSFLLAVFDPVTHRFQSVCRLGTGFSDEFLTQMYTLLQHVTLPVPHVDCDTSIRDVDVWLEPKYVWEVKAADLTISPVHTAAFGKLESQKGIALRFPRFIRVREDKSPSQATTADDLAVMYQSQSEHFQAN